MGKTVIRKQKAEEVLKYFDWVLVRNGYEEEWKEDLFCSLDKDGNAKCMMGTWEHFFPFDGNEYLLGTNETWKGGRE